MKKFLILQMRPEDEVVKSEFEAILRTGGLIADQTDRYRVEQDDLNSIELANYCAIIAGGSPYDVSLDQEKKSVGQLRVEEFFTSFFHNVVADDVPFLGACSGNGLLGSFCGATISTRYNEPVSCVDISITNEGKNDPLLEGFPATFKALVGHKEACDDVPPGAVLLASSALCQVQMFRVKNNIYATQFHPEADAEEFILRIDAYKEHGYFEPSEADRLMEELKGITTPYSNMILARFVERYKNR